MLKRHIKSSLFEIIIWALNLGHNFGILDCDNFQCMLKQM